MVLWYWIDSYHQMWCFRFHKYTETFLKIKQHFTVVSSVFTITTIHSSCFKCSKIFRKIRCCARWKVLKKTSAYLCHCFTAPESNHIPTALQINFAIKSHRYHTEGIVKYFLLVKRLRLFYGELWDSITTTNTSLIARCQTFSFARSESLA